MLLPVFLFIPIVLASECEVSPWTGWSRCFGDCSYGQQVRNRDVDVPPMPETSKGGAPIIRICPHLYETRFCMPSQCESSTMVPMLRRRWHPSTKVFRSWHGPSPLRHSFGDVPDKEEKVSPAFGAKQVVVHDKHSPHPKAVDTRAIPAPPLQREAFLPSHPSTQRPFLTIHSDGGGDGENSIQEMIANQRLLQELKELEANASNLVPSGFPVPVFFGNTLKDRYPHRQEPQSHFSLGELLFTTTSGPGQDSFLGKKQHRRGQKGFGWSSGKYTTPRTPTIGEFETTTEGIPDQIDSTTQFEPTSRLKSSAEEDLLRGNDVSGEQPIEDISILGLNDTAVEEKKNMDQVEEILHQATASTTETTLEKKEEGTTRAMWLRGDPKYIPNTRQHASDITKQLYITGQIVQAKAAVPDDRKGKPSEDCPMNARCCMVNRNICPDGSDPVYVKRYYRPRNAKECVPYRYPRCDRGTEMAEQPIQYSQNCEDLCFATVDKQIQPLFVLSAEV